jgi:hypothetical protein
MSGVVIVAAVAAAVAVILQKRRMSKLRWKKVIALYLWQRWFLDRHGLLPPLIVKPVRSRHPATFWCVFDSPATSLQLSLMHTSYQNTLHAITE